MEQPRRALGQSTRANIARPTQKQDDRLQKLTLALEDAQAAKAELSNTNSSLATELRLAAQREAKLKLALEKWEKSGAQMKEKSGKLASLQSRLEELQRVHEESKARRTREVEELRDADRRRIAELDTARARMEKAEKEAKTKEDLVGKLRDRIELIEQGNRTLQDEAKQAKTKTSREIDSLRTQLEETQQQAQSSLKKETASLRAQLESQQEAYDQEVQELEEQHERNLAVLAIAAGQAVQHTRSQAESTNAAMTSELFSAQRKIMALEATLSEKEAQMTELVAVVKQVQSDRDSAKQSALIADADLEFLLLERELDRSDHLPVDLSLSLGLGGEDAGAELEEEQARTLALSNQVSALHAELLSSAAQLSAKQGEVDLLLAKIGEGESHLSALQAMEAQSAESKRELRAQQEANRTLSSALSNARVAEEALQGEVERLAASLDSAAKFEELYLELCTQTRHLLERHALAEEEKATLSALNAELLSHANPSQKQNYVKQLRRELDELKQHNVAITLELEECLAVREELEEELSRYKCVDVPLGMRPKADVVRVRRAEELTRSTPVEKQRPNLVNSAALRVQPVAQEGKVPRPRQTLNPAAIGKARRVSVVPPSSDSHPPTSEDHEGYGITHSTPAARRRPAPPTRRAPLETIPIESFSEADEMTLDELLP